MTNSMAYVCDPRSCDRESLYENALARATIWLDHNLLPHPTWTDEGPGRDYGRYWFKSRRLFVNVPACRMPAIVPAYAWSFPGWKADCTPYGVLMHELGHHVHACLDVKYVITLMRDVRSCEPPVSSYEPNPHEVFAEAFKVFMTNPNLLAVGRPLRFMAMLSLGLRPLHAVPWNEVLGMAHEKYHHAAAGWIKKGSVQ